MDGWTYIPTHWHTHAQGAHTHTNNNIASRLTLHEPPSLRAGKFNPEQIGPVKVIEITRTVCRGGGCTVL